MKNTAVLVLSLILTSFSYTYCADNLITDWLIVGAGPAGIATAGVLIDLGIDPHTMVWLDPEFNVVVVEPILAGSSGLARTSFLGVMS